MALRCSCTLLSAMVALGGCAASMPRFPLAPPMWVDHDVEPFSPRPEEWYSSYAWDGADNAVFRPLAEAPLLELDREAINVNSLDEVPDSSWFTNRLSRRWLSPEEVARGACSDSDPATPGLESRPRGPFTITSGKPDGATPGFFVRDADGDTHLMKTDGTLQPERGSAADAIVASVFHAAGYFAPCNRVVLVTRDELVLEPGAEARYTSGHRRPLTQTMIERVFEEAAVAPDGRLRFGLSQFVEGDPIAPWRYEGTWDDDPNDVVPHEHRRELRGMYVLSSWLGHIDSRQENTLASWMQAGPPERGYVRHYVIDFSDSLGVLFPWDRLARRFGHSGYFDVEHMVVDGLTLGVLERPWDRAQLGPAGATLGYFDVVGYEPDEWRPGYPNPAFDRRTERDMAWMARILSRLTDAHVRALVERGHFSSETVSRELVRVLIARRDLALERWLTRLSPLTHPVVADDSSRVCVDDLTVLSGIRTHAQRSYTARGFVGEALEPRASPMVPGERGRVCVTVPRVEGASVERPSYLVLQVVSRTNGSEPEGALRLHAYDVGARGVRVVGLQRLEGDDAPRP